MNIFRLAADSAHLVAIAILLAKIWMTRSCAGISGRSQILFLIVFVSRYLDLFTNFVSLYNSVMKILFLASSIATVYLMFVKFRATYDKNHDVFRLELLIVPAFVLALLVNHEYSVMEIMWTFSIYLEAVAIMPQLFMLSRTGSAETITAHYLFALGSYRALYILNWVFRYYTESFLDPIAVVAGIVQTVLYADFFYLYVTRGNYSTKSQHSIASINYYYKIDSSLFGVDATPLILCLDYLLEDFFYHEPY
uniref:ER lumen protein-retaining receptor n=1 Tax=Panagrolaimus sp. ES5 TaxID=591445 RepID=A0AC34GTR1_9BILA